MREACRGLWDRASALCGQSVEQMDTDGERQLLARDGVDERFEDRGEARRFEAAQLAPKPGQRRVAGRQRCEAREVDGEPEKLIERASSDRLAIFVGRLA